MKKVLWITVFLAILTSTFSKNRKESNSPLIGTWKYTAHSVENNFQYIFNSVCKQSYSTEFFIFENNNVFRHEFINNLGNVVKILKGKWKSINDKVTITYSDVKFSISVDYFFLDKDLVLGRDFNHVIFSRSTIDLENIAMKMK